MTTPQNVARERRKKEIRGEEFREQSEEKKRKEDYGCEMN